MTRPPHGLTLIEVAIALALAAFLFAIGIPAYQARVTRAVVAEAVELAAPAQALVQDYVDQHGRLPETQDIALPFVTSRHVAATAWTGAGQHGAVSVVTRSASGTDPDLDGRAVVLSAAYDSRTHRLAWTCGGAGTTVPSHLLPAGCSGT